MEWIWDVMLVLCIICMLGFFFPKVVWIALYDFLRDRVTKSIADYRKKKEEAKKPVYKATEGILLGVSKETGEEIRVPLKKLYSMGISGTSGSGKTTYVIRLLSQLVGAPVKVCDIHYAEDEPESLGYKYIHSYKERGTDGEVFDTPQEIREVLTEAYEQIRKKDKTPMLIVIDEYTSLLRLYSKKERAEIISMLLSIIQEGRKYNKFVWLLGHSWKSEESGGTDIRDGLQAFVVLRQRQDKARIATGLNDLPKVSSLPLGEAYLIAYTASIEEMIKW